MRTQPTVCWACTGENGDHDYRCHSQEAREQRAQLPINQSASSLRAAERAWSRGDGQ